MNFTYFDLHVTYLSLKFADKSVKIEDKVKMYITVYNLQNKNDTTRM